MGFLEFERIGEAFLAGQSTSHSNHPWPKPVDLAIALGKLTSLYEGQPVSHALEIAVYCGVLGNALIEDKALVHRLMLSALLHDTGLLALCGELTQQDEENLFTHSNWHVGQLNTVMRLHTIVPDIIEQTLQLDELSLVFVQTHHQPFLEEASEDIQLAHAILRFSDALVSQFAHHKNLKTRFELAESFLSSWSSQADPEHAIVQTFKTRFEEPEDYITSDLGTLTERFWTLFPQQSDMLPLNGIQVLQLMRWLAACVDNRQPAYTLNEAEETAELLVKIGLHLRLPMEALGQLSLAGLLHDIGKLAVPLSILNAEHLLNGKEQDIIRQHALCLENIFPEMPGFTQVTDWLVGHHEKLNGTGYPWGKRSHELSVGARMVAISDAFIALTRPRPYRTIPYRPQDALSWLKKQQGRLYDPSLLGILEKIVLDRAE